MNPGILWLKEKCYCPRSVKYKYYRSKRPLDMKGLWKSAGWIWQRTYNVGSGHGTHKAGSGWESIDPQLLCSNPVTNCSQLLFYHTSHVEETGWHLMHWVLAPQLSPSAIRVRDPGPPGVCWLLKCCKSQVALSLSKLMLLGKERNWDLEVLAEQPSRPSHLISREPQMAQ